MRARLSLLVLAALVAGCQLDRSSAADDAPDVAVETTPDSLRALLYDDGSLPSDADVEAARLAGRGRAAFGLDTAAIASAARGFRETAADLDSAGDWRAERIAVPVGGDVAGPSVLMVQVLLSRAGFSPGEIDGRWGDNTEVAVAAFQRDAGLRPSGVVDDATRRALVQRAGRPAALVTTHVLTADDVEGPFEELPADVYEQAELERLSFESLSEKLGERFHASPALLARLNGGRDLDALAAGDSLRVPHVADAPRAAGAVERVVVNGRDGYLQAVGADGRVVFHAPVTLGSRYNRSPEGDLRITGVARDPSWHYQPALLTGGDPDAPTAVLPPGPNSAVGTVWMALSRPHYGIHGTKAPHTIGTAASSGCVRLTNWDAQRLAGLVRAGTTVRFEGTGGEGGPPADSSGQAGRPAARTSA